MLLISSLLLLSPIVGIAQTNGSATHNTDSTHQPSTTQDQPTRWSEAKANAWYAKQPWPVGANYIPRDAINQLEMWQAATFNPQEIDQELGWAQAIGMNTMRVFLHDLLWQQDPAGFQQRINTFLTIANKHKIRPVFVLFDSCWEPDPKLGPQHPPIPGVHNSGWVQSPGMTALADPTQYPRLEAYVKGVVGAFANDPRILAWDLWNEPDNGDDESYDKPQKEKGKNGLVAELLPQVFSWARSQHPIQPLTSGVFYGDWDDFSKLKPVQKIQISESDILSFHNYSWPEDFEKHVVQLQTYHRPIFCTEYMARGVGSTFDTDPSDSDEVSGRGHQLGPGQRKNADESALGFVAASICIGEAAGLVSRCFLPRWQTLPSA